MRATPIATRLTWYGHSSLHYTAHPGFGIHYEIRAWTGEQRHWRVLVWEGSKAAEQITEFPWLGALDNMTQKAMLAAEADFILRLPEPQPAPAGTDALLIDLFMAALGEARRAMQKFPQPNYTISKVAEEAGEVIKAAIHCAEGRESSEAVVTEIRQAMAMLIRLYIEGDQVHGLAPLIPHPEHEAA